MAAPTFVKASIGEVTPGTTFGWLAGDPSFPTAGNIIVLHLFQDGTGTNPTFDAFNNVEALDGTDSSMTLVASAAAVGGTPNAKQFIHIGRSMITGTPGPSADITTAGDDLYCRMYEFATVSAGTTLATVIENSTAGSFSNGTPLTQAQINDTAVVTLGADRLALNLVAVNDDNAVGAFTGMTGGTWAEAAEYAEPFGTDATIQLQTAAMASAGTIDGGSYTMVASDAWGVVGFALIGTTVADLTPRNPAINHQNPGVL
jgi:hypothetical protein